MSALGPPAPLRAYSIASPDLLLVHCVGVYQSLKLSEQAITHNMDLLGPHEAEAWVYRAYTNNND
jgi:hypothetical protein